MFDKAELDFSAAELGLQNGVQSEPTEPRPRGADRAVSLWVDTELTLERLATDPLPHFNEMRFPDAQDHSDHRRN